MKTFQIILILLLCIFSVAAYSQQVTQVEAITVATNALQAIELNKKIDILENDRR
jgi:hypothetical protein